MKKLITFLILLSGFAAFSQTQPPNQVFNGVLYQYKNSLRIDSNLFVPKRDTIPFNSALSVPGNIRWRPADSLLYYFKGDAWKPLASGTITSINPANDYTFAGWDLSYHKDTANAQEGILMNIGGDTLINIFSFRIEGGHTGNDGKIVKRYSNDGGVTWGSISDVYESIYDDRNIAGGKVGNRLVVFFSRYNSAGAVRVDMGRIYSDDNGATWSAYSTYTPVVTGSVPFGNIVKANGKWLQSVYHLNFAELAESTDGATWTHLTNMWDYRVTLTHLTSEVDIVYFGQDSLIALARNETLPNGGSSFQFKSIDNGNTWAYVDVLPFDVVTKAPALAYDSLRSKILYSAGERSLPVSENKLLLYSAPNTVISDVTQWAYTSAIQRPVPNSRDFYGYPFFAPLDNGDFAMIFTDRWQIPADTSIDMDREIAALYHTRIQYLGEGNTPSIVYPSNLNTNNIQGDYYKARKDNSAFSYDTASNLITAKSHGVVALYGKTPTDTLPIFETRTSTNNTRFSIYGTKRADGTIATFTGFVRMYGLYATNINVTNITATTGTFGTVVTSALRSGQSAGKVEWAAGSSGPTSILGAEIDLNANNGSGNAGGIDFRGDLLMGSTPALLGQWRVGGNFNAVGSIAAGTQLVGRILNSGSSVDSLQIFGGGAAGFQGGGFTAYGGSSIANAGAIIARVGTVGGGVKQQEGWRLTATALMGIRNSTPTSVLHIGGSVAVGASTVTGDVTLNETHCNLAVNNSANQTTTLPAVASCPGREYTVVKISNNAFTVTVGGSGSEKINGATTYVLTAQYNSITFWNTGTQWIIK